MKGIVRKKGDQLVHEHRGETLVIEPWGRDGLRVRATVRSQIENTNWALTIPLDNLQKAHPTDCQIEIADTGASITNGRISARMTDNQIDPKYPNVLQAGYLQFFKDGELLLSEYDYVVNAHNPGTRTFKPVQAGLAEYELCHSEVHFAPIQDERFYGMGLNATGSVDLKGSVIDLYQRHVKHTVPFLVSSKGYGLLWNNPSLGRVELGHNRTRWCPKAASKSTIT